MSPLAVASPMPMERSSLPQDGASASPSAPAPKKVALFVEPSPFSHISGMKNRFECLIKGLRESGDEVLVVTPCVNPPKEYFGAKVRPLYTFARNFACFVGLQ